MTQTTSYQHQDFDPIVVADIGGTNARFAIVTHYCQQTRQFEIQHQITYPSADFQSFEAALTRFLSQLPIDRPKRACLAVAGPIKSQQVYLTNLGWHFGIAPLKEQMQFDELAVINDFAAFAYAAPYLDTKQNLIIKSGQPEPDANIAVMGPGTGFGAACLARDINGSAVMSCEAGHINLAPVTALDRQLLHALRSNLQHVSIESVFSGPGIARLYRAMAEVKGHTPMDLNASQISQLAPECEVCDATLTHFCDWMGSVAGDLALTFGALGGVYIGGGILPRMTDRLLSSRFIERFTEKGLMSQYVGQIPVTLVVQDNIPLIGAAACLHERRA
ncbi:MULTISPECIES: glucokinase [Pseudoalteromonas]|uniref:Glucokinase n=1 Tax=Pseudoalteromonas amylolytica TaxID=1859457 RepID=A0A1S1MSD7_9GAMM|nr:MULTISPECIES: glucokinase [Pseudoalteromonas]MCF6435720.1 glucokinase [Pseudoalteromonas sp. MMG022]OHU86817.1 glucokinase [Pseudoalteromonas sp. JW3]OHU89010.1 glucokinase [Pseudoalteromonas amylolytica]